MSSRRGDYQRSAVYRWEAEHVHPKDTGTVPFDQAQARPNRPNWSLKPSFPKISFFSLSLGGETVLLFYRAVLQYKYRVGNGP